MTRPIADLDVPLPTLREQIAALVTRQNPDRAERSAARLRSLLAPSETTACTHLENCACPPEEATR